MAEVTFEVQTVGVDYICDKCWKGKMVYKEFEADRLSAPFQHACDNCGDIQSFPEKYPTVRHLRKQ